MCSRGGWQSRWLPTEVRRRPFNPSNLPWIVSQCPFDPYRADGKGLLGISGGRVAYPTENPAANGVDSVVYRDFVTVT
jgi:hypothetical protein